MTFGEKLKSLSKLLGAHTAKEHFMALISGNTSSGTGTQRVSSFTDRVTLGHEYYGDVEYSDITAEFEEDILNGELAIEDIDAEYSIDVLSSSELLSDEITTDIILEVKE